jgi:N-acetylneuraminic acid mutarotase
MSGRSERRASLPTPRRGFALAELDGKIYAIGGFESHDGKDEVSGSVMVYDPAHDHARHADHAHHPWRETASLHHPRAYLAAASAGGKLFALGGEIPGLLRTRRTAICESFDPYSDNPEWIDCGAMLEPRSRFGLASHRGSLFAVGGLATGHFGGRITGTVERFYPELIGGDWSCLLSALPEPRSEAAVAFLDDRLFCAGGRKDGFLFSRRFTRDCQVFEAELNQWTAAPPIPVARHKASLVARGNTLYAVGGRGPAIDRAEVLAIASCYYVFTESDRVGLA